MATIAGDRPRARPPATGRLAAALTTLGDAPMLAVVILGGLVLVAIFGVLFLSEHLSARNWAGIAMIAVGAVLVALK